jgi:hypothetical protein
VGHYPEHKHEQVAAERIPSQANSILPSVGDTTFAKKMAIKKRLKKEIWRTMM